MSKIKKFVSASRSLVWLRTRGAGATLIQRFKDLVFHRQLPDGNLSKKLYKQDEEVRELALAFIAARDKGRKYQLWMWMSVVMSLAQLSALRSEDVDLLPWAATAWAFGSVVFTGWYILASRAHRAYRRLVDEINECYTEVLRDFVRRGYTLNKFLTWDRSPNP